MNMVNVWNCAAPTELLDLFIPLFSTNISLLRSSSPFHVDSFIIIEFFRLFFQKHHYLINILSSVGANYRYTSHIHLPRPSVTHSNWLICKIVLSPKATPSARGRGICSVGNAWGACQRWKIILIKGALVPQFGNTFFDLFLPVHYGEIFIGNIVRQHITIKPDIILIK